MRVCANELVQITEHKSQDCLGQYPSFKVWLIASITELARFRSFRFFLITRWTILLKGSDGPVVKVSASEHRSRGFKSYIGSWPWFLNYRLISGKLTRYWFSRENFCVTIELKYMQIMFKPNDIAGIKLDYGWNYQL